MIVHRPFQSRGTSLWPAPPPRMLLLAGAATLSSPTPVMSDTPPDPPIRLALNENPFGPSPLSVAAIKADLAGLARYTGREVDELTAAIAAHENIAVDQIVLGENLNVLG